MAISRNNNKNFTLANWQNGHLNTGDYLNRKAIDSVKDRKVSMTTRKTIKNYISISMNTRKAEYHRNKSIGY
jgi:hypothetical protein